MWRPSACGPHPKGFRHRCESIHGSCDGDVLSPTLPEPFGARTAPCFVPHRDWILMRVDA